MCKSFWATKPEHLSRFEALYRTLGNTVLLGIIVILLGQWLVPIFNPAHHFDLKTNQCISVNEENELGSLACPAANSADGNALFMCTHTIIPDWAPSLSVDRVAFIASAEEKERDLILCGCRKIDNNGKPGVWVQAVDAGNEKLCSIPFPDVKFKKAEVQTIFRSVLAEKSIGENPPFIREVTYGQVASEE